MADNNRVNKSAAMSVKPRESRSPLIHVFPPQTAAQQPEQLNHWHSRAVGTVGIAETQFPVLVELAIIHALEFISCREQTLSMTHILTF